MTNTKQLPADVLAELAALRAFKATTSRTGGAIAQPHTGQRKNGNGQYVGVKVHGGNAGGGVFIKANVWRVIREMIPTIDAAFADPIFAEDKDAAAIVAD